MYIRLYLYLSAVLPAVIVDAGERRSNEKIFFNSLVAAYTGVKHSPRCVFFPSYVQIFTIFYIFFLILFLYSCMYEVGMTAEIAVRKQL